MKVKSESEVAQSCPTLSTPWTAAYQAPPSMGFSRQEYWSGVPLPSPGMAPQSVLNLSWLWCFWFLTTPDHFIDTTQFWFSWFFFWWNRTDAFFGMKITEAMLCPAQFIVSWSTWCQYVSLLVIWTLDSWYTWCPFSFSFAKLLLAKADFPLNFPPLMQHPFPHLASSCHYCEVCLMVLCVSFIPSSFVNLDLSLRKSCHSPPSKYLIIHWC